MASFNSSAVMVPLLSASIACDTSHTSGHRLLENPMVVTSSQKYQQHACHVCLLPCSGALDGIPKGQACLAHKYSERWSLAFEAFLMMTSTSEGKSGTDGQHLKQGPQACDLFRGHSCGDDLESLLFQLVHISKAAHATEDDIVKRGVSGRTILLHPLMLQNLLGSGSSFWVLHSD